MAYTLLSLVQPFTPKAKANPTDNSAVAALLGALMLSVFAAQRSKKALRQFKRKAVVEVLKYKMKTSFSRVKTLFSKRELIDGVSDTTLLYILLGVLVLVLLLVNPIVAIILLLVGILLILLTKK